MNSKVYVMRNGTGLVKVGISSDTGKRLKQILTASPLSSIVYETRELSNAAEVEKASHLTISDYLVSGEWFNCKEGQAIEVVKTITRSIGKDPDEVKINIENGMASIKIDKWKQYGCTVDRYSLERSDVIAAYMDIDDSKEFLSLDLAEQYLVASNHLALIAVGLISRYGNKPKSN